MNVVDIINKAISERRTRFAFELLPPLKGDGCCGVFGSIDRLIGFDPAYINVTFHREGIKQAVRPDGSVEWHVVRRRPGTVGISAAIQKKYDVEVVPHLICGGQSKYDIEDALIDLDFLGLHNVLALRGDKSQNEKFFMPHPQGHTHAVDLVRQIAAMNRGQFVDGEVEECHHSKFSIGVAGYPEMHEEAASPEADIACLKAKVDAGAEYVVTQLFYDNARFFDYVRRCRERHHRPDHPGHQAVIDGAPPDTTAPDLRLPYPRGTRARGAAPQGRPEGRPRNRNRVGRRPEPGAGRSGRPRPALLPDGQGRQHHQDCKSDILNDTNESH